MKKIIFLLVMVIILTCPYNIYAQDIDSAVGKLSKRETKQEGIKEIEQIGIGALSQLQEVAKDKNKEQGERIPAIILLGKIGNKDEDKKEIRKTLEDILKNEQDKFLKEAACLGLGYLGDKGAISQLKEALNDGSGNVRMRSAWALAKLGDNLGKKIALQAIKGSDVTAQLLAIDVLEAIGNKDVISELETNISNPDATVWTKIHSKIGIKRVRLKNLKGQKKLNFLEDSLKDSQLEVNQWAARELGKEIKEGTELKNNALEILKGAVKDKGNEGGYSARKVLMILLKEGKVKEEEIK